MEDDVKVTDSWEDYEDEDSVEFMSEPESDELKEEVHLTPEQEEMVKRLKIRKLTPEECFILMGSTQEDCQKCKDAGVSNSQLYKQAGKQNISA
jgi:site-specific DNA-cytosine methylase